MRTACLVALAWAAAATAATDPAPATPPAPKTATRGYNCRSREVWSAEKAAWCCEQKQLGCKTDKVPEAVKDEKRSVGDSDATAPERKREEKSDDTDAKALERREKRTRDTDGKMREARRREAKHGDDSDATAPVRRRRQQRGNDTDARRRVRRGRGREEKHGRDTDAEAPERTREEKRTRDTGKRREAKRGDDSDATNPVRRTRQERGNDAEAEAPAWKRGEKDGDDTDADASERTHDTDARRGSKRGRGTDATLPERRERDNDTDATVLEWQREGDRTDVTSSEVRESKHGRDTDAKAPEWKRERGNDTDAEAPERKRERTRDTDARRRGSREEEGSFPERRRERGHDTDARAPAWKREGDDTDVTSSEKNETQTFDCRTRATWSEEKAAWCCKEVFAGCGQKYIAEQTSRDILKAAEERRAGHRRRGLRMTIAGDKDEVKTNPRALLKRVRKMLLKASAFLRKHPSALVVKRFNASGEDVPIFREWNDKLAKEEALESGDGRQALSLQAASDIDVSYDIVSQTTADVDAAVDEVAGSLGAAATTPREGGEGDADHLEDGDHEGEEDGDGRSVVKRLLFALVGLLGCGAVVGLVVFAVHKRRNKTKKVDETETNPASTVDGVPMKDCESQLVCNSI